MIVYDIIINDMSGLVWTWDVSRIMALFEKNCWKMMMNQWMEGGSLFLSVFFYSWLTFRCIIWNAFPKQRLQMKTMVCFCSSNLGSLLGTKIAWSGHYLPWLLKIPTCSIGTSYGLFSIYVTFLDGNWLGATQFSFTLNHIAWTIFV